MKAVCKGCGEETDDIARSMMEGCDNCGKKLFAFKREEEELGQVEPVGTERPEGQVSIKVKGTGEYLINLLALVNRKGKNAPIIVEDDQGVVRIVMGQDDE